MTDQIIKVFKNAIEKKGYKWFDSNRPFNLNIVGMRSPSGRVNFFDDYMYVLYRDWNLNWVIKQWPITTMPGSTLLRRPQNNKGTAILVPGQYKGIYKLDLHAGKYLALCQRLGDVSVYRDNDKDDMFDLDSETIDSGKFGINIHRAGVNSTEVNGWSAGCQVFKRYNDYKDFLYLCKTSSKLFGNRFTYTLIDKEDIK